MAIESFSFDKGINRKKSPLFLQEGELYSCSGFKFEHDGVLETRIPKTKGLLVDSDIEYNPVITGIHNYSNSIYISTNLNWIAPKNPNLIGWYRFNEGGGLVAYNGATDGSLGQGLLPNLTITNTGGNFWTFLPGVSSVAGADPTNVWVETQLSTARTINGTNRSCCGIFYNPNAILSAGGVICVLHDVNQTTGGINYNTQAGGVDWRGGWNLGGDYSPYSSDTDWRFVFYTNPGNHYFVKSDGTLTILGVVDSITEITLNYIHVGVWYTYEGGRYSCQGSFGDYIIYNFDSLSLAQWAKWYDQLRTRYGMAARSGW